MKNLTFLKQVDSSDETKLASYSKKLIFESFPTIKFVSKFENSQLYKRTSLEYFPSCPPPQNQFWAIFYILTKLWKWQHTTTKLLLTYLVYIYTTELDLWYTHTSFSRVFDSIFKCQHEWNSRFVPSLMDRPLDQAMHLLNTVTIISSFQTVTYIVW